MQTLVLEVVFGAGIGLLLGLVGGGGSIITVPILVYAIGLSPKDATATSLVIVGLTALLGAMPHAREGRVDLRTALAFGAAGIAGAFAGTWLNHQVSGPMMLLLFGVMMLVVAARMAFGKKPTPRPADFERHPLAVPVAGLAVGVMTGFFGVGGGFLIVPALVLALGLPMKLAVGTSLVIIAMNSASGVLAHLATGGFDLEVAAAFVLGGFLGSQVGGRLAGRIDDAKLSKAFAGLVAAIGVFLIVKNAGAIIGTA
jgi:uncharacterized membrane protein YfcA